MATRGRVIKVVIKAEDRVSKVFKDIQAQLNRIEKAVGSSNNSIRRMTTTATTGYSQISSGISTATARQNQYTAAVIRSINPLKQLTDAVKTLVVTYMGLNAAESLIKTSDAVTLSTARIDLFNDGLQTTEELTDSIYQAAQRSRGSYIDMMDLVAKYSAVAGDNFNSTQDVVAFSETLQKMFVVSGATTQEMHSAALQLKQALGTGRLMGEEFRAIMESAPLFGQAIAEYMTEIGNWGEVAIGDLKKLASESQITSDIMVGAMFRASGDISKQFEEMPYTFAHVWTKTKNVVIKSLDEVWKKLTSMLNEGDLDQFLASLGNAIIVVSTLMVHVFTIAVNIFNFISTNWGALAPIIMTIATALIAYKTALVLINTWNKICAFSTMGLTILKMALGMQTSFATKKILLQTAAQKGLNKAQLVGLIISTKVLLIAAAIIAVIYIVVAVINQLAGTTISATGIILGVITTAISWVVNMFIGAWNIIVEIFAFFWDVIAMVANFLGNAFTDPVGAVANLFIDLADLVLSVVEIIASAIDAVTFGAMGLADGVQGWRNDLKSWGEKNHKQKVIMEDSSTWAPSLKMDEISFGSAWGTGYKAGQTIDTMFNPKDTLSKISSNPLESTGGYDWSELAGEYGDPLKGIAGDVSDIKDGVNVSNEDLKYLRQLAERRTINKFTTAEIKIDMNNANTINGTQDIDGIVKQLEDKLYESMSIAANGVHI